MLKLLLFDNILHEQNHRLDQAGHELNHEGHPMTGWPCCAPIYTQGYFLLGCPQSTRVVLQNVILHKTSLSYTAASYIELEWIPEALLFIPEAIQSKGLGEW